MFFDCSARSEPVSAGATHQQTSCDQTTDPSPRCTCRPQLLNQCFVHGHSHCILKLTVSQPIRLIFNFIGALALILVPLAYHDLSTTDMFGIAVGITWAILIVNVVGILPSKSALKNHDHTNPEDPFHPERTLMIEETLPSSGMPRSSMTSLRSRSSHQHPEAFAGTEPVAHADATGHSKV